MWQRTAGAHLTADHDMGDFRLAVTAVCLVVSGANRQDKVTRVTLAFSHQEAAVLALLRQQLLSLPARQVAMEPSEEKSISDQKRRRKTCRIEDSKSFFNLIWRNACKLFPFSKYK